MTATLSIGIVVPAFNTTVETEYAERRPAHVRHFVARIAMADRPLTSDAEQAGVVAEADRHLDEALVSVAAARPDVIALGISIPAFWHGIDGARVLRERCEQVAGRPVVLASDAVRAALLRQPTGTRVGILTPYQSEANQRVAAFVTECGVTVTGLRTVQPPGNFDIARVASARIVAAAEELIGAGAQVLLQVGTNLVVDTALRDAVSAAGATLLAVNGLVYDAALTRATELVAGRHLGSVHV